MGCATVAEGERDDETTRFNAKVCIKFFEETMSVYGVSYEAFIGDNVSSNRRVEDMMGVALIGCASHKLNLEAMLILLHLYDLDNTISSSHNTMHEVKKKVENAAAFRNLTDLRPTLDCETRWPGKVDLPRRSREIRSEFIDTSEHFDAEFAVNSSSSLGRKV